MPPGQNRENSLVGFRDFLNLFLPAGIILSLLIIQDPVLGPDPLEVREIPEKFPEAGSPRRAWLSETRPCGITLALHSADRLHDYEEDLREIVETGATWVQLKVSYFQKRADSSRVGVSDIHTATPARVEKTIEQARSLGLRVALLPVLLLQRPGPDDWRGNLRPLNRKLWHKSYRRWITEIASQAERGGVEILCVGSELNSMQLEGQQWNRTISSVRSSFSGAVIYSANWDCYQEIPFLDSLDGIGISAYHPLASNTEPSVAEMVSHWLPIRHQLTSWQREQGIPLIFAEIGYASIDGIAMEPWDYTRDADVDLIEQADAYLAFKQAWQESPELGGVFFYAWYGVGGDRDRTYTPRGKPALEVIKSWIALWEKRKI